MKMKRKIILLIEDDELDVMSVERSLRKLDGEYELYTAFNGLEALDMVRGKPGQAPMEPFPDLILLDLNMPKMSGLEFLRAMRSDDRLRQIKVFVITTSGEPQDRNAATELGISGYLIKPMSYSANYNRADSMEGFVQFHIGRILRDGRDEGES